MDLSSDAEESGYSEDSDKEICSDDHNHRKTSVKKQDHNSGKGLYAAIRLYVGKGEVNIISVNEIKEFDQTKTHFPYSAYVANGFNEENQQIFEPASILAISQDKKELRDRTARWPKPNKRRSTVIYELAEEALKKEKVNAKKDKKIATNTSKKVQAGLKVEQKDHFVKMEKAQRSMKNKIITLDRKKLNFDFEKKEESVSPSLVSRTRKRICSTAIPAFTQNQTDTNNLPESPSHASRKRKRSTSQGTPVLTHIETDTCTLPVSPVLVSGRRNRTSSTMTPAFKQNKIDTGNLPLSAIQALRTSKRLSSTATPSLTLNETDADNLLVSPSLVSRTRKRLSSTVTPAFTLNETDTNNLPESSSQASQKRKRSTSTPQATTILTHMEIPVSTSKKAADNGKSLSSSTRQNHPKTYSVSSAATRDHLPFSPDVTPTKLAQKSVASTPPTSRNSHSNPMKPRRILAFEDNAVAGPSGVNRTKKSKEEKTLTVSTKGKFTKQVEKKRKYKKKIKECFYDSDDYSNSGMEKKNKLTKWEDTKIDDNTGKIVKTNMFHIHYGVSVPYKNWKRAINATTSYKFLRELVVPHIWNLREFVQRAVQVDRTNSQEERVELTPRKREALKRGYVQYLLERNFIPYDVSTERDAKSRKERINKFGRELGVIICQERSKLLNRHDEEAEDSSHSPRESDDTDS